MAHVLSKMCGVLSKHRSIINALKRIYGPALPYVMIYSTVLVTLERVEDDPELRMLLEQLRHYDPVKIMERIDQHFYEKYLRKVLLKAVRREAERVIASALMNVLKNTKGIDVKEIISEANRELSRLIEAQDLEGSVLPAEHKVPQNEGKKHY